MSRLGKLLELGFKRRRSDADYRALQRYLAQESINELNARGIDVSESRVIEVGAGRGGFSSILNEAAHTFVATDLVEHESFRTEGIPFQQLDATKPFPFADGSFDLVFSTSLIEHLAEPENFLAESKRVLIDGGRLYLSFPPFFSLSMVGGHQFKPFHFFGEKAAVKLTNRVRGTDFPNYHDAYDGFGLTPLRIGEVHELLSQHFEVDDVYTRFLSLNTARWPGWLGDLATWHACFVATKVGV